MDEFELIERFFAARARARDDVRVGIGDDAAVTRIDANAELVIATDSLVEGTHFPAGAPAHALGHRCLAVNLSDLAAMGAQPLWCTLALSLPDGSAQWVDEFSAGFMALADTYDTALVGGDTVRGPLAMTVTVHGRVAPGAAIRRDGAAPGQAIYVTGCTGQAAAGLALMSRDEERPAPETSQLVERFWYPAPRVGEGRALSGIATAMIDISDGLHVDASRLLRASGVGAQLDLGSIRVAAAAVEQFGRDRALEFALLGGDDYELCFTVPTEREVELRRVGATWDCGITCIGRTESDLQVTWTEGGRVHAIDDTSFRHFAEAGK